MSNEIDLYITCTSLCIGCFGQRRRVRIRRRRGSSIQEEKGQAAYNYDEDGIAVGEFTEGWSDLDSKQYVQTYVHGDRTKGGTSNLPANSFKTPKPHFPLGTCF